MGNKTLIIAVLNKAYVEDDGMLDLFLRSLREGEDTEFLTRHLLLVAVDQTAFNRCRALELNCYQLVTEDVDFSEEVLYMSENFIKMMWKRTLFLGDILRRGYSFIFTLDILKIQCLFVVFVQAKADSVDKLGTALQEASMGNKTLIISVLNEAYVEENGMLDLFLRSLREGEGTEFLIKHILIVAVDQIAFDRCRILKLHCYQLAADGVDLSKEQLYMSDGFINMMWQRTLFLGDVLKRGYSFIFTDMDVMWLRNPFPKLNHGNEDLLISCDRYNGQPFDVANPINTGFYFVSSNNKTIALFDEWYGSRNNSAGMKDQDVLSLMKYNGAFEQLGMKVRFLDTLQFSGFCQDSKDINEVITVHANCCRGVKAKLADLTAILNVWKIFDGASTVGWPAHEACSDSWREEITV
ncbi:hypothetical protein COCNU_07G004750 [Cocos nucifera]|uniref:Nucleotide-diphospho-sugar transferase domain-containing protein n=1 Tax=Cocos nucifera TaxID=13894 RepID=A0A8K0N4G3_COCNU|nr:hypothetical protein COCNU_07G004750 [Cocos nucifera]